MRSFVISDNRDTWVGMRLAGIQGVIAHEKEEILAALKTAVEDKEIGIIMVTEKIVDVATEEIMALKLGKSRPLIIEIPDRHGGDRGNQLITTYIRESVGIRI